MSGSRAPSRATQAGICYGPTGNVIGDETGFLIHHLQQRRQLLVSGGFGPDRLVYLYGWVRDGNLVTAAGVSAGIDMALWLVGQLHGVDFARKVQKGIEYFPAPPYAAEV